MPGSASIAPPPATGDGDIFSHSTPGRPPRWSLFPYTTLFRSQWLGSTGAMAGDPVVGEQPNGDRQIYYRSNAGQLQWWYWNAAKGNWSLQWLGSDGNITRLNSRHPSTTYAGVCFYSSTAGHRRWRHFLSFHARPAAEVVPLSLHDALPISVAGLDRRHGRGSCGGGTAQRRSPDLLSLQRRPAAVVVLERRQRKLVAAVAGIGREHHPAELQAPIHHVCRGLLL